MGQYFIAICLKSNYKRTPKNPIVAAIKPHDYDNGAKLMEHSYAGNNFVNAAMAMLNQHNGCRFVWCGDYDEDFKVPKGILDEDGDEIDSLYGLAENIIHKEKKNPSHIVYNEDTAFKYAVNHDKKEYVAIPAPNPTKYVINPLPLLCANSNGLGGGDFWGDNEEMCGHWAYDHIEVTDKRPSKAYKSITKLCKFIER